MDTPDIEAEGVAGGGQVGDLLKFRELERSSDRSPPAPAATGDRMGHA